MNTKNLTLQQIAVIVEIDRLSQDGGAPTTREVGERHIVYSFSADSGVFRGKLGYDATNSAIRRLVKRAIVERAGVGDHNAATWKLTDEARTRLRDWRADVERAEADAR